MCQFAWGHRVPLTIVETLFLGVSLRMFSDEINICICRLSKQIFLPSVYGLHQSTQGLHRIKGRVRTNFLSLPYCLWTGTLIFSCLQIQTWTEIDLHHQLFCFSGPSDFNWNYTNGSSGSELLSLYNCVSQLLYIHRCALYMFIYMSVYKHIYTCILLVMFLWRTLANTVCPNSTSFIHLSRKNIFFESLLYAGHSSTCLNKTSMHSSSCRSLFFSD